MDFYIVDAFSDRPFGGNPAGIILYENLEENTMQSIAAELKFSETAFVKQLSDNLFKIRYFTPKAEVELCGHATIASFKALCSDGIISCGRTYFIETLSGNLTVDVTDNAIMMKQASPVEGKIIDNNELLSQLGKSLNLDCNKIGDDIFSLKPQIISTGLYDIILPVKNANDLNSINPDFDKLSSLSKKLNVVGVHAFTLDVENHTARCRNFAPLYGINEESATGTSNGALTYFLYKNSAIKNNPTHCSFIQGEKMGRPSVITTKIIESSIVEIYVGGPCHILSKGILNLK